MNTVNAIRQVPSFSSRQDLSGESGTIELLIPDMKGEQYLIEALSESDADVIGHNIETVERLYDYARPQADYTRSIKVLSLLKRNKRIMVKSAVMVGLGETKTEILDTLRDLKRAGVDIVHIGQYLRPSRKHLPVKYFYTPEEFNEIKKEALNIGIGTVSAGPLVRSSYKAKKSYYNARTSN